jgi:GT2 family glycosyltransferase
MSAMFVSVVIPTYQRRASLGRVLAGLARQEWPSDRLEVLVISDGGRDGSIEMARAYPMPFSVTALEQPHQGPAVARNLGVARASGALVLFVDDDVVPEPHLVAEHVRAHDDRPKRVVIGPLLEPAGEPLQPWVRWEARTLAAQYEAMSAGRWAPTPWQFYTGNASVGLEHLRAAGGFDHRYRRAEDVHLAFRLQDLGCEFFFNPAAAGRHIASRSYSSWLDAAYQYGRNDILFGKGEERAATEFRFRHPMTRALVRWGLRRRTLAGRLSTLTEVAIRSADYLRLSEVEHQLCSAIFNLQYWFGVSDQLGSAQAALALAELGAPGGLLSRVRSSLPIGARGGRS